MTGASGGPPAGEHPRPRIERVDAEHEGLRGRVAVALSLGGQEEVGTAEGPGPASALVRLTAEATLQAVTKLQPGLPSIEVDATGVTRIGEHEVAAVAIKVAARGQQQVLVGSARVGDAGSYDAVARAALDATNRRLPALLEQR